MTPNRKLTTLLFKSNSKSCELAEGSQCRRFNLSSLSRQSRNLEGKKRGALILLYVSTFPAKGEILEKLTLSVKYEIA